MKSKIVAYSIIVLLFQSCVVYDKTSVSLNEAAGKGNVKIISAKGQVYKFKNIALIDSAYYGMGREYISQTQYVEHEGAKTSIDSTQVERVLIKNTQKSKRRTILLVASIPAAYLTMLGLVSVIFFVIL